MSGSNEAKSAKYVRAELCGAALLFVAGIQAGCSLDGFPMAPYSEELDGRGGDAGAEQYGMDAAEDAAEQAAEGDAGGREAGQGTGAEGGEPGEGGCVQEPVEAVCGNQVVEEGEQCDDGKNGEPEDGCRDDCSYSCVDAALDCDDDTGDCRKSVCTEVQLGVACGEETDESDVEDDGDPCTDDFCDGLAPDHRDRSDGYPCENGTGPAGDYCKQGGCIDPVCGDGVRGSMEQCDDGGNTSGDGCSSDCALESCGDGKPDEGEDCDDGADADAEDGCDDDCHFTCFIAELDCPADLPGDCAHPTCQANATGQVCGEQFDANGMPCDNLAGKAGDYCYAGACVDPVCGDLVRGPLEECDHENQINAIGCSSGCQIECPEFTVRVPPDTGLGVGGAFCMDRYEASRSDATSDSMGGNTSMAVSRPDVIPWSVNPMSGAALTAFQAACAAAGKYLCGKQQWYAGCTGPARNTYVFGDTFDPEICNCVATFCDDYCVEHGIDPGSCNTNVSNCGYDCGLTSPESNVQCMHVVPTGRFPGCASAFGALDVNGNLWEVVPSAQDARGYEIRGGAFNCAAPATRLQCAYNATWNGLYAGFRCCADIE